MMKSKQQHEVEVSPRLSMMDREVAGLIVHNGIKNNSNQPIKVPLLDQPIHHKRLIITVGMDENSSNVIAGCVLS